MIQRDYFETEFEAWTFAQMLPKGRYTIMDYGKDETHSTTPYYIEYLDIPKYKRI